MRPRHRAFHLLGEGLSDRPGYLASCSTAIVTHGEIPKRLATYRLDDEQCEALLGCRWSDMDMVNSSTSSPNEGFFWRNGFWKTGLARSSAVTKSEALPSSHLWCAFVNGSAACLWFTERAHRVRRRLA